MLAELTDVLKSSENSEFYLGNISDKIMKEIRTIGLNKLVAIAGDDENSRFAQIKITESSFDEDFSKLQKAKQILKSHETLLQISEHNKEEFKGETPAQDEVISLAEKKVTEDKVELEVAIDCVLSENSELRQKYEKEVNE